MHLILGLGNPGRRYERTRHNAGFLVIDRMADRQGAAVDRAQFGALVVSLKLEGSPVVLAKPQSFMNLSGQPAASLRGFYKVEHEEIVVVHDDVDLPFGEVRVKKGGGHGGHNGLKDLQEKLGTPGFIRVRIGVGRPPSGWETADWVLSTFLSTEEPALPELFERAADAATLVVQRGVTAAMNQVNTRRRERADSP